MSMLKTIDSAGQINDAHTADPKAAFHESLQRVEDAFTVALKAADDRAAAAEAQLAATQAKLVEAERKLDILKDLKKRLEGL